MSLLDTASLILTPNGYKDGVTTGKLYSVKPTDASGDMVVTRNTTSTRVDSAGLIQNVAFNAPRIDYTSGGCPSILVEPARTNLVLYSEQFDLNPPWATLLATVTANNTTAPDGNVTADKLVATAAPGTHYVAQEPTGSVSGTTVTVSVFAKASGLSNIQIVNNAVGAGVANFILSGVGTATLLSGVSATITPVGDDGWYRCRMTYTPGSTGTFNIQIRLADSSGSTSFTGNDVYGVSLWGAQLEVGSYPTSYIPTVAGTVSRNDDVISKTGISSLIGQAEGTIFWDIKDLVGSVATGNPEFMIRNTAFTNWIGITTSTSASPFRVTARAIGLGNIIDYTSNITSAKACLKYGTFGAKLFLNGNPTPVATTVNPNFSFDNILFSGARISFKTNRFALWTTALSDAQCKDLTT